MGEPHWGYISPKISGDFDHVDYKFLYGGIFQVNLTMWITRGRKQSADQPAKTKYVLFSFKIKNL